jgi:hypothetical protein
MTCMILGTKLGQTWGRVGRDMRQFNMGTIWEEYGADMGERKLLSSFGVT